MTTDKLKPDKGSSGMDRLKDEAVSAAEEARDAVTARAERAATDAGDRVATIAEALKATGDQLKGKEDWLANAAHDLGSSVEDLSAAVREEGLSGARRKAEHLARDHPGLFVGATVLAGLAIGRLLRVSAHSDGAGDDNGGSASFAGGMRASEPSNGSPRAASASAPGAPRAAAPSAPVTSSGGSNG